MHDKQIDKLQIYYLISNFFQTIETSNLRAQKRVSRFKLPNRIQDCGTCSKSIIIYTQYYLKSQPSSSILCPKKTYVTFKIYSQLPPPKGTRVLQFSKPTIFSLDVQNYIKILHHISKPKPTKRYEHSLYITMF